MDFLVEKTSTCSIDSREKTPTLKIANLQSAPLLPNTNKCCVLGRNRSHDQPSLERKPPLYGEALSQKRVHSNRVFHSLPSGQERQHVEHLLSGARPVTRWQEIRETESLADPRLGICYVFGMPSRALIPFFFSSHKWFEAHSVLE